MILYKDHINITFLFNNFFYYKLRLKNGNAKINIHVYIAAIVPWSNLPRIYGFIDISLLDVILKICKSTEIPPKPSKKAA